MISDTLAYVKLNIFSFLKMMSIYIPIPIKTTLPSLRSLDLLDLILHRKCAVEITIVIDENFEKWRDGICR